jgi:acyl-CoA thioesterase
VSGGVPQGYEFDAATHLTTAGDGVFEVEISDQWSGLASVNGGFLMATCLQALGTTVPFPDPVTVSGLYLRPGNAGPAVVRTELIRAGRTTAFGEAHLLQAGKEVLRVTSAFADLSAASPGPGGTPHYAGAAPPKLPAPEDCLRLGGISAISLAKRFEYRAPAAPGWMTGTPSGDPFAEFWMRFADGRPADPMTLPLIVDAAPPAVLELGLSSTTIELTVHVRARPAPGWLACRASTRFVSGGYHEEDFEAWDSAGVLVAQSRQLALVRPFGSLPPGLVMSRHSLSPVTRYLPWPCSAPPGLGTDSRARSSPRRSPAMP